MLCKSRQSRQCCAPAGPLPNETVPKQRREGLASVWLCWRREVFIKTLSPSAQCPAVTQIHTLTHAVHAYLFAWLAPRHYSEHTHTQTHRMRQTVQIRRSKELGNLGILKWVSEVKLRVHQCENRVCVSETQNAFIACSVIILSPKKKNQSWTQEHSLQHGAAARGVQKAFAVMFKGEHWKEMWECVCVKTESFVLIWIQRAGIALLCNWEVK